MQPLVSHSSESSAEVDRVVVFSTRGTLLALDVFQLVMAD